MNSAEQIAVLIKEMKVATAEMAIRKKARQAIEQYSQTFGDIQMPIDMAVLASFHGIAHSNELPSFSEDAELVPDGVGGVKMRVNPDQPETRQRFSIAHEISHTFFPQYSAKIQCRTDARHRNYYDSDNLLEALCDIGASELLFPHALFSKDIANTDTIESLNALITKYRASREATLRRFAELHPRSMATVFLEWKLKPTQKQIIGPTEQANMFGFDSQEEIRQARMLRIAYAIPSSAFSADGHYLPKDKSIKDEGPILETARQSICTQGDVKLNLGTCHGIFRIQAIPLYTHKNNLGPNGEVAVAAVIEPLEIQSTKRSISLGSSLFDN